MVPVKRLVFGAVLVLAVSGLGMQAAQAQSGTVYRWGGYHTVGFGVTGHQDSPTVVPGLTDVLALAEGVLGRKVPEELGQAYGRRLLDRLRRELKPVAGVKAAVAALPYRRCVASSSSFERIHLSLDVTGLAPLFDGHIFSATQVAHGKPAPDLHLFAARTMGVAPDRCVVVEDSPLGVTAAVAAGMTAVGFTGAGHATVDLAPRLTAAGARCVLASMRELPATIAGLDRP